jgi:hypothetical protein
MMYSARFHAMLVASLAASGCGGGSGSSPNVPVVPPGKSTDSAHATFVVKVPAKAPAGAAKHRHYITSNVQGISFSVTDATNPSLGGFAFYPLTPTSPGCTGTVPSGITCTLDVVAPPGNDTFVVDLYDSTETGAAYVISTGTVTAPITAQASNVVTIVTDGVPTWAVMGFADQYPVISGMSALDIDVADASGDLIVGSYDVPITLADSDASGATSLSKMIFNQPSDTIGVTLNWNGATIAGGATITMNSSDPLVVNQVGSSVIAAAQIFPGGAGPTASQGAYYFANASAASQPMNVVGVNGSAGPYVVSNACNAFITISGFSPNFTIAPLGTTAPLSGGFPVYQSSGTCQFGVTDSLSATTYYDVMVGQ